MENEYVNRDNELSENDLPEALKASIRRKKQLSYVDEIQKRLLGKRRKVMRDLQDQRTRKSVEEEYPREMIFESKGEGGFYLMEKIEQPI